MNNEETIKSLIKEIQSLKIQLSSLHLMIQDLQNIILKDTKGESVETICNYMGAFSYPFWIPFVCYIPWMHP